MINNFYERIVAAKLICGLAFSVTAGFFIFFGFAPRESPSESNTEIAAKPEGVYPSVKTDWGALPLSFEANRGQTDEQVKFISRGQGFALFLTEKETVLSLRKRDSQMSAAVLRMRLDGANQTPEVSGEEELAGKSNYFIGSNPDAWKHDVPNFSSVRYREVYPGVDQIFYGNGRELEYDFIVAPEADFRKIALAFEGASDLKISAEGDLILKIAGEEMRQKKPFVYQEIDGARREIAAAYSIGNAQSDTEDRRVRFEIGDYDRSKPLVIDPVLVYSTYLGGNGADSGRSIAIDAERNVYVTGATSSTNFPTVNPLQPTNASPGFGDVYVTKINAAGNQILYSTYFGGSVGEIGYGIDVDAGGNIYVTGVTGGTNGANNFPTTPGAFDRTFNAPDESFLFKLNAAGNTLVYSTYTGATIGFEVKVDKTTGEAFVAGNAGANLTTTPGAFSSSCSSPSCAFVTKFNAAGSALVYSTYIGAGPANDLAIDAAGNAYITGSTISSAFPVTPGAAQPTCAGCNLARSDAFVTKLNPTGTALVYSTFLGGSIDEVGRGIAVDAAGNAYVTGRTESSSAASVPFPTTPGAFQTTSQGTPDGFVTKVNPTGTAFLYSTYLGGGVRDEAFGIAVDPTGSAHVIGQTRSTTFPLVNPFQANCPENGDCVFMASLNPAGAALVFSTFFGQGEGLEVAADNAGNIYATGVTYQGLANLPTMNPIQPAHGAGNSVFDAFVAKIEVRRIQRPSFDYDGDGKADASVFRPSNGTWYISSSSNNAFIATQFGANGDLIAPADFDGDGRTDIAVFRPTDGTWYRLNSANNTVSAFQFGAAGDLPVPGDFDGDGKADLTVYRPSASSWYRINSSNNQFVGVQFGIAEDKPLVGDFDGDGKSDLAVYRPSNGTWYRINSGNDSFSATQFGIAEDKPVPADYDGDGKTDLAVYRPSAGSWFILNSGSNSLTATQFGVSEDRPAPADFDGDGRADLVVFRPSAGTWYLLRSTAGFTGFQFGANGDIPTPNAFVR